MAYILSLDQKLLRSEKGLSPELQVAGYMKGVFHVSDKTHASVLPLCTAEGCLDVAQVFESRLVAVIDATGTEILLEELSPEVLEKLTQTHQKIQLCLKHIFEMIADYSPSEE